MNPADFSTPRQCRQVAEKLRSASQCEEAHAVDSTGCSDTAKIRSAGKAVERAYVFAMEAGFLEMRAAFLEGRRKARLAKKGVAVRRDKTSPPPNTERHPYGISSN